MLASHAYPAVEAYKQIQSTLTGAEAKRARESVGVSQTKIAAAVGLNRTYYSLFEAGRYVLDTTEEKGRANS